MNVFLKENIYTNALIILLVSVFDNIQNNIRYFSILLYSTVYSLLMLIWATFPVALADL